MNKKTLKAMIIELKDSGMTYTELSRYLKDKYDIDMSRQSICGMYKRATSDKYFEQNLDVALHTDDIINYNIIGYSASEIKQILQEKNVKISLSNINDILNDNTNEIEKIKKSKIKKVEAILNNDGNTKEIIKELEFKHVKPKVSSVDMFITDAINSIINTECKKILVTAYKNISNIKPIKSVINEFGLDTNIREIQNISSNT